MSPRPSVLQPDPTVPNTPSECSSCWGTVDENLTQHLLIWALSEPEMKPVPQFNKHLLSQQEIKSQIIHNPAAE